MVYTCENATAQELHHYGSVLAVVPREELRTVIGAKGKSVKQEESDFGVRIASLKRDPYPGADTGAAHEEKAGDGGKDTTTTSGQEDTDAAAAAGCGGRRGGRGRVGRGWCSRTATR